MNNIIIDKPNRQYRVGQYFGEAFPFWFAEFRPRNPKSGKPWQASRGLVCGDVSHSLWKADSLGGYIKGSEVVRPGLPPQNALEGGWGGCRVGYASKEAALAAVEIYEASRS